MKRSGADHPKVAELAKLLNVEIYSAVGILELLWHFTAKYAPQGDVGKYSDSTIARAVHWQKHTGRKGVTPEYWLSSALVEAKCLDSCDCHRLVVHDWPEHADQQVKRKLASQNLVFAHPINSLPEPVPVPEPVPAAASAAAAASRPARKPPNGAAKTADEVCRQVLIEMGDEGLLPPRFLENEYGKLEPNPVTQRIEKKLQTRLDAIREARYPDRLTRKIILDELKEGA
jgi:hypothetical protein